MTTLKTFDVTICVSATAETEEDAKALVAERFGAHTIIEVKDTGLRSVVR